MIIGTSGDSLGSTTIHSHPNRYWWKFWETSNKYSIVININMSVNDPTFYASDGSLFTPGLTRVLAHELAHAYNYVQHGATNFNHVSIQIENQIMQQLDSSAIMRHPSRGHGRGLGY